MAKRKKQQVVEIEGPEFECSFLELKEFPSVNMNSLEASDDVKPVRYHNSMFWSLKGFGVTRWVLCGYILVDWKSLLGEGHSIEEIYRGCVKYLNKPPERRKFQKRVTKPLYGNLDPTPVKVTPREKNGKSVLEVLAVTNKRKLKSAWGEGQTLPAKAKRRTLI